jgi:hypothetical protein
MAGTRAAYRWFVAVFREAAEKLRAGDHNPAFPLGSFPPGLAVRRRVSLTGASTTHRC